MSEFNSDFSDNLNEIKILNENNPPVEPVFTDLQPTNVLEKVEEVSELIYNNGSIEEIKENVVSLALEQITQIHNEIEKTNNSVEAIEEIINDPGVTDKETIESLVSLTNEIKEEAVERASEKINAIINLMDRLSISTNNVKREKVSLEEPSLLMELLKKEFLNIDLLVSLMDNTKSENIVFFRDLEVSYSNIVKDGKIDSNDIPELLNVINNIYGHLLKNGNNNTDLYILTQNILFSSMRIYLDLINCPEKDEIFKVFKRIVVSSIKLIQKQTNKQTQSLFYRFLCCK